MTWLTNAPKVIFCGADFRLGAYPAPRLPIVRDNRLRVDANVAAYFRYLCRRRGGAPGSLKAAAYILRDWMAYLQSRSHYWTEVTDDVVAGWCSVQLRAGLFRGHRDGQGVRRLNAKVHRVFDFYYVAEHELGLVSGLIQKAGMSREEQPGRGLTIVDVEASTKRRRRTWEPGVRITGRHPGMGGGRPTPDGVAVEKIQLAGLDRQSTFAAATHGLILALMSRSAPRAAGVAGMTVDDLSCALTAEGILDRRGPAARAWRLDEIAGNFPARRSIMAAIEVLAAQARSSLFVPVVEKGGKARQLEVPHELFVQLLEYVWDQRDDLVNRNFRGKPGGSRSALWLSLKTRQALTAGAIGNMAKAAFGKAEVAGSGHRLRAYAIENKLVELLRRGRARAGRSYSMDDALFSAAQYAGHAGIAQLKSYANKLRRRDGEIDQPVIGVSDRRLADELRALARLAEKDEAVRQALSDFMQHVGLQPQAEAGSAEDMFSRIRSLQTCGPTDPSLG